MTDPSISYTFYPITEDASKWRDLSLKKQKRESRIKTILFAAAIILLIGIILGIYFSAATTSTYIQNGKVVTESNAIFSCIPIIFGLPFVILFALIASSINFDKSRNGDSVTIDPNRAIDLLTRHELKDIYDEYYKKNGGLKGLVRQGIITVDQANQLRALLKEYHKQRSIKLPYETPGTPTANAIQHLRFPQKYQDALNSLALHENRWNEIRQAIRTRYGEGLADPVAATPRVTPTELIPSIEPMPLTKETKSWRNITPEDRKKELTIKITCLALIVIILCAVAISSYFLTKTTYSRIDPSGAAVQQSNAVWNVLITPFAGVAIIALGAGAGVFCNFSKDKYAKELMEDAVNRDNCFLRLTEDRLYDLFNRYYSQGATPSVYGGIQGLIRNGILTIPQGEALRDLFIQYKHINEIYDAYADTDSLTHDIHTSPEKYPAHQNLKHEMQVVKEKRLALQKKIRANFIPSTPPEEITAASTKKETLAEATEAKEKAKALSEVDSQPSLDNLPPEILQYLFGFLTERDLGKLSQVSTLIRTNAFSIRKVHAHEYGYREEDFENPMDFLKMLLKEISLLLKKSDFPESYKVYRDAPSSIDVEATYRKFRLFNSQERKKATHSTNPSFLAAVLEGNLQKVKILMILGNNLETRDTQGNTPLILAARKGNQVMVELLINQGADKNALNKQKETPLSIAVSSKSKEVIQSLVSYGIDLSLYNLTVPTF